LEKPKGKAIPNLSLRFLFGKTLQCVVREEKPEEELMQFFLQSETVTKTSGLFSSASNDEE
jgi:hypothetical protein